MARTCCAERTLKATTFKLTAPQAKKVSLGGTFNNWNPKADTAKKDTKGNWTVKLDLPLGRHEYKFFVDGAWVNDPNCKQGCVTNAFGTQNCVIEIK